MRKKVSLKALVNKNRLEISKDQKALEKIENKIEKKHS
ncbi:Fur-regulated basic protein B [Scopulibacillus darangshiensis]|uniref:Fur-regulated basic protein B n=1 Tax=Scopulibacillus darangshiensis TaxID=442528 RepID=A0A4R2P3M4_9BACL|nr:FbpB family small basic protein [Scopulibacillus darangshiensis]TCP29207.1 Fur-regulated basic protein B [Scopulibacillus darangshiensis]